MKKPSMMVVAGALLFSGCIPSVNPFYSDKDIVFDARLLGEWQEKGSDQPEVWNFEKADETAYKLRTTDKTGKQGQFKAHLFKLKEEFFLDLVPTDCDYATNQAELVAFAMFPGHLLMRVPQLGPELQLAGCDYDWLQKHLEANPKALAHHKEGDRLLLTADTRALQRFVLKHLGSEELFEKPGVMVRKHAPATP